MTSWPLERYEAEQNAQIATVSILLPINVICIIIRFYRRKGKQGPTKNLGLTWSDWTLLIGFIFTFAYGFMLLVAIWADFESEALLKYTWISGFLWIAATTLIKVSLLLLYYELFPLPQIRRYSRLLIAVSIIFGVAFTLVQGYECIPLAYHWDPNVNGSCINLMAFIVSVSVLNTVLDLAIMVLPVSVIKDLHMSRRRKLDNIVIFSFGWIITGINIARTIYYACNPTTGYRSPISAIFIFLEVALGIIAACLPTIKPAVTAVGVAFQRGWKSMYNLPRSVLSSPVSNIEASTGGRRQSSGLGYGRETGRRELSTTSSKRRLTGYEEFGLEREESARSRQGSASLESVAMSDARPRELHMMPNLGSDRTLNELNAYEMRRASGTSGMDLGVRSPGLMPRSPEVRKDDV